MKYMTNENSSKGRKVAGMKGPLRSPAAMTSCSGTMSPSIAKNTTTSGIAKASAPIQSPMNGRKIVKYTS